MNSLDPSEPLRWEFVTTKTSYQNQSEEEINPEDIDDASLSFLKSLEINFSRKGILKEVLEIEEMKIKDLRTETSQIRRKMLTEDLSVMNVMSFGHIKIECANLYKYHKVNKKAFQVTHNDEDVAD